MLMTRPIIVQSLTYLFLSKLVEKIVLMQLTCDLEAILLLPKQHSGFRRFHLTETVLSGLLLVSLGLLMGSGNRACCV